MSDILLDELTNDPLVRGYAGMTDEQAASDLNTSYRTRNKTSMTGREVAAEIVDGEYDGLTDAQKAQVIALISSEDLDPFGFPANVIKDIFPGSTTLSNLAAARIESISRATELGLGRVRVGEVEEVRRG